MLTQTMALFIDSYRELSAKKIFWISMAISGLIVLVIAAVGISDEGNLTVLWFETSLPLGDFIERDVFYKTVFSTLGFRIWLAWGATILALASTAGVFPEFLSSGSIDLTLSKPIGRARLFLTKYVASLLFVALQVGVFSVMAFLVIGIRGSAWEPAIFYSVPLVTIFYSYLFCVCALFGVLTRSAITSLIATGVFWFVVFVIGSAETTLLYFRTSNDVRVHSYQTSIASLERRQSRPLDESASSLERVQNYRDETVAELRLRNARANLESAQADAEGFALYHRIAFGVKTLLPKTSETLDMLEYRLISMSDMDGVRFAGDESDPRTLSPRLTDEGELDDELVDAQDTLTALETENRLRSRSAWWILGTSLLFEVGVLGIAVWRFRRRDF